MNSREMKSGDYRRYRQGRHLFTIMVIAGVFVLAPLNNIQAGFDLGADVVSRYIWRGTDFGNSASVQPYVSYGYGMLEVGAWSSWAVTAPGANENDLYLSSSLGPVSFVLTDYYFPVAQGTGSDFFDYDQSSGNHILEFGAGYGNGPFSLFAGYNFWGDSENSVYLEGSYEFYSKDKTQASLAVGAGNGFYLTSPDDTPDLVNVAITAARDIFSVSYILNPNASVSWMVFGVNLSP